MRSTRDTSMQEMQSFKQKIKDQNQRLIQLSQEKAKLDAKSKVKDPAAAEQMQAQFTSKQVWAKYLISVHFKLYSFMNIIETEVHISVHSNLHYRLYDFIIFCSKHFKSLIFFKI